ncbi:MAG: hypothetical protein RJA70_1563 [Pseudomonadota bacterium]|jgi:transcriptional regulator with XRE-family HTH domain
MSQVSANLACNIRELREQLGLSQQQIAKVAQVPRPTWANLESGEANPTVSVLTRVASALSVRIEELLAAPKATARHFPADTLPTRRRGQVVIRSLLPEPVPGLQLERMTLPPLAQKVETPHGKGTREYLICEVGELELSASGNTFVLQAGDVLVFRGDQRHSYTNIGRVKAIAYSVITLAGSE